MAKSKQKDILKKLSSFLIPLILSTILLVLSLLTYQVILEDKYYPFTFVGDTNISFLTEGQAIRKLQNKFNQRASQKLQFGYAQGVFQIDIATSSAKLGYSALSTSFDNTHAGSRGKRLQKQLQFLYSPQRITPGVELNLDKQIATIQTAIDQPYINAQLTFDEITTQEGTPSARIQIQEGVEGLALDEESLTDEVVKFILTGKYNMQLPTQTVTPKVTTEHVLRAKGVLEDISKQPIKLTFEDLEWILDAKQLLTLLNLTTGGEELLDKDQTKTYLRELASEINQEVQEGLFEFNPQTKRVSAFRPSQEGRKLDEDKTYKTLVEALEENSSKSINLPVNIIQPKIATSDVNSLGIKELLDRGISRFAGSIPNRIYNVNLTAQKINGVLVPPGEIFSFNRTVGDITAATGFKQAYVIKEGRTVLDDGGGVCQDSTTLFRAVLNAGLPVIKRTAHAYRVGYYEQGFSPGLDATVFYPSVDFQFKNDTPAHVLIQAYTVGTTLYVDLYGTADGREVTLTKPIVTNQAPPPPELRQDDPTLPKGTVKQVDWAAWGAKVTFKRTVTRAGEVIISDNWISNYKPWQAVYLVGTQ